MCPFHFAHLYLLLQTNCRTSGDRPGPGSPPQCYSSHQILHQYLPLTHLSLISFRTDSLDLLAVQGDSQGSSPTPQFKSINYSALSFLFSSTLTSIHQRRQCQPPPVLLPGESRGQWSLVGCWLWGLTESGTTEAT